MSLFNFFRHTKSSGPHIEQSIKDLLSLESSRLESNQVFQDKLHTQVDNYLEMVKSKAEPAEEISKNLIESLKGVEKSFAAWVEMEQEKNTKANDLEKLQALTDDQKRKAALALNMCTISISRITQTQDLNVMEQEYEAILNNLNLQQIIKDQALLDVITHLMDTITFYRIQAGDYQILEKEYQNNLNNAFWNSLPGINSIVVGTNPWTMALSAVHMIGVGYMNYRSSKHRAEMQYDKEKWQLQRSAIEQLNGIKQSLFVTAWRLSDNYDFPDAWRLTERQINQYNEILEDNDTFRKFERLDSLSDTFEGYYTFWYYKARAALACADTLSGKNDPEGELLYKGKAREALNQFDKCFMPLLREDIIASSAALDKILLLQPAEDRAEILKLLDRAQTHSKHSFDVLQICALHYLNLGEIDHAEVIFRKLSNEGYNLNLNARLLSRIYCEKGLQTEYNILTARVGQKNVLPWEINFEDSISKYRANVITGILSTFEEIIVKLVKLQFSAEKLLDLNHDISDVTEFSTVIKRQSGSLQTFLEEIILLPEFIHVFPISDNDFSVKLKLIREELAKLFSEKLSNPGEEGFNQNIFKNQIIRSSKLRTSMALAGALGGPLGILTGLGVGSIVGKLAFDRERKLTEKAMKSDLQRRILIANNQMAEALVKELVELARESVPEIPNDNELTAIMTSMSVMLDRIDREVASREC